jgi:hypothetical protein
MEAGVNYTRVIDNKLRATGVTGYIYTCVFGSCHGVKKLVDVTSSGSLNSD